MLHLFICHGRIMPRLAELLLLFGVVLLTSIAPDKMFFQPDTVDIFLISP